MVVLTKQNFAKRMRYSILQWFWPTFPWPSHSPTSSQNARLSPSSTLRYVRCSIGSTLPAWHYFSHQWANRFSTLYIIYSVLFPASVLNPSSPTATIQTSILLPPRTCKTYDLSMMVQFFILETFMSKLAGKLGGYPTILAQHSNSLSTQHWNMDCFFCLDPHHFYCKCSTAKEYICKGLCKG